MHEKQGRWNIIVLASIFYFIEIYKIKTLREWESIFLKKQERPAKKLGVKSMDELYIMLLYA